MVENVNSPVFQSHMQEEHNDIRHRITALESYVHGERSTYLKQSRGAQEGICKQLGFMQSYARTLDDRLGAHVLGRHNGKF
jgi:hypothetical protein